ncbi:hypothetical protein BDV98DRAFT_563218 [Pterulicium gracile]|uniref:Uncharacterized protein n=1 Tax=Pterulicium gracile TaxID=1884261 RepID=A0A5C3QZR3_9AGAR|nr:hypothetical protein BDV98DRAFT_563218 [Pterula gracilis]
MTVGECMSECKPCTRHRHHDFLLGSCPEVGTLTQLSLQTARWRCTSLWSYITTATDQQ